MPEACKQIAGGTEGQNLTITLTLTHFFISQQTPFRKFPIHMTLIWILPTSKHPSQTISEQGQPDSSIHFLGQFEQEKTDEQRQVG